MQTLVGDGTWLTVKEVMARLAAAGRPVSDTTVRTMMSRDLLRGWYTEPGRHARIEPASVDELIPLLLMKPGEKRDSAMDALRERNAEAHGAED